MTTSANNWVTPVCSLIIKKALGGFLNGRDVFVTLPTDSGKSVCYVALPLLFESLWHQEGHIILVVSPLIALMQDQVSSSSLRVLSRARARINIISVSAFQSYDIMLKTTSGEQTRYNIER